MQNLLAVVLCGGGSKRMGTDKGLIGINDTIWSLYIANKVKTLSLPVVFSINETQVENYLEYIPKDKLIIDEADVEGPLKGLLSVYRQFPDHDIFLLACDMIDLDGATINYILQIYKEKRRYDFYVYQDKFAEPFCGIYTSKGLKEVFDKAEHHTLSQFSFQKVLDDGNTLRVPIKNKAAFKNFNLPI